MIQEKITAFLFNHKKYKFEKFGLTLVFWFIALFLLSLMSFSEIFKFWFAPVLATLFVLSIVKILWYNKTNNIKPTVIDMITPFFLILVLIGCFYID
ncbi:hypothetical protein [Gracilibacillus salinarum]|uniref:Uncharacterized protein n=1 Tax=Gracilibacillus salinarum TaxID=2932255 RepID=A0ABY4GTI0_9BACI|nr:hypothetical protein [Gracilibacillus salinarum]UOQ87290.1 hypothetical protein MUN87_10560 [Gracilibacillus salinarum]